MEREFKSRHEADGWVETLAPQQKALEALDEKLFDLMAEFKAFESDSDDTMREVGSFVSAVEDCRHDYLQPALQNIEEELNDAAHYGDFADEEIERGMANFRSAGV